MTVDKRLDELEKGNRRLPAALCRYLTVMFFMSGIIGTSPTSAGEEYIVDSCVDFGFLSPHGYGINASIALDIDVLSSFKPYAGAGINVLSGLTYPGGVEYRVQIEMENAPGLTISSLLSSGGHHGTSKRHKWAFVSG